MERRLKAPGRGLGLLALLLVLGCRDQREPEGVGTGTAGPAESDSGSSTGPGECAPGEERLGDLDGASLELVAAREQIPGLAEQPSVHGQILGSLFAFDSRLHLGYGDYSDNTGPIAMNAWDPAEGIFVDLGVLPTEEVLWFLAHEGSLYTPAVDPDGHQEDGGIYRLDCGATGWQVGAPIEGAVHVYDVAVQGDTLYAGTGSLNGEPALLMASRDRGESWDEVLRYESGPQSYSRFYFLGATEQRLFVSGRELPSPGPYLAWIREGNGPFEALENPPEGSLVPIVLGEQMVVADFSGNPGRGRYQATYRIEGRHFVADHPWPGIDGDGSTLMAWAPEPEAEGEPERLLVLMQAADGAASVHRADALDPGAWQPVAQLPALPNDEFVSMAALDGALYLGTREGSLYALGG